jgi:hypothetical protein
MWSLALLIVRSCCVSSFGLDPWMGTGGRRESRNGSRRVNVAALASGAGGVNGENPRLEGCPVRVCGVSLLGGEVPDDGSSSAVGATGPTQRMCSP